MDMLTHNLGWLTALIPISLQLVLFLRWLHRQMRNDEIVHECVRNIALSQLPYIHSSLRAIAGEQRVVLPDPPLVQFVDFNGRRH
jgi:hypothetical protein